jgi:RNA polymerase sigma-70 factor, ECF subfamily
MRLPPDTGSRQDGLYAEAAAMFGPALQRLARAYEPDADRRLDLLQEIHVALWRSFASFNGSCSLRTWVYRVAHNVAISQVIRQRSKAPTLVGLDELELEPMPVAVDHEQVLDDRRALDRMMALIHQLDPLDRQVILLYLEGLDAASIGDITGISAGNVATKVHRVKKVLAQRFQRGTP